VGEPAVASGDQAQPPDEGRVAEPFLMDRV
jgi:hypothetical protein